MNKTLALFLAASIGFGLSLTGGALAYAPHNPVIRYNARISTLPPLAYQLFCLQNPSECRASSQGTAHFDSVLLNKITRVNATINQSMRARSDGKLDVWTVGATAGDCEDYALNKRHRLIALGVPSGALRMAVVKTASGEGHAVLVVHTDNGDYVMDNLTTSIKLLGQSGLRLVAMSSANPDKWKNS